MKVSSRMTALLCIALTACASTSPTSKSLPQASAVAANDDQSSAAKTIETSSSVASPGRLSEVRTLPGNAVSERIESQVEVSAPEGGFLTSRGYVLRVLDESFVVNATSLLDGSDETIRNTVSFMTENEDSLAVIEGHTDNSGSYAFNLRQSHGKAVAVRDALMEAGVDSERLSIRKVGGSEPIADNETVEGRRLNRRVEIVFSQ